jgi:hypothetical protein
MKRRLPARRPSPAMVVAVVALVSSLTGGAVAATLIDTGDLSNGAVTKKKLHKNAVNSKKVKNKTLKAKDFAEGQLEQGVQGIQGLEGDKGEKGEKGDTGDTGEPGSAAAYVLVNPDGTIDASRSKNVAQAQVEHTAGTGVYCFDVDFVVKSAVGASDNSFANNDTITSAAVNDTPGSILSGCPAGLAESDVRVRNYDVTAAVVQDKRFMLWLED